MKCLVINLDRSPARLAHVTAEFARIGVAFERVAAVDGQKRPELAELSQQLTLTEIACFLSHKACWAIIAEGDDAYGAVFEDDTVLSATAGPLLADTSWIPADADVIKLETFFKKTVIAMKRASVGHGFSLARLYGTHLGTAGYIVSRKAARDLLAATQDIGIPVDHVIFDPALATSSSKTIYQILPALCIQDQFLSDNATGLPSLLNQERRIQWSASGRTKRRKKAPLAKIAIEAKRIWWQIFDVCRLRREKTIPFDYRGQRVRPPHTHNRENAL